MRLYIIVPHGAHNPILGIGSIKESLLNNFNQPCSVDVYSIELGTNAWFPDNLDSCKNHNLQFIETHKLLYI